MSKKRNTRNMTDQEIKWRMTAAAALVAIALILLAILLGGKPS